LLTALVDCAGDCREGDEGQRLVNSADPRLNFVKDPRLNLRLNLLEADHLGLLLGRRRLVDRLIGRLVDVTNGKVQVERARH
jgi:hypothetical protein